jgi:hypothetical protein
MTGKSGDDRVLVGIAAAAAFAAGLVAVAQHADCTTAGYRSAVAQREGIELRRQCDQIERRVAAMSTAQAATARIVPMKLTSLKYPKTWNVVSPATPRSCAIADATTVLRLPETPAKGIAR